MQGDLDAQTEVAWAALAERLAEVMEALEPNRFLCIEVESWEADGRLDGAIRYVQVMRLDDGVHVEASSNYYLATRFRLGKQARATLRSLGLKKPGTKGVHNYWSTFGLDCLDHAAEVLVQTLRDGFGVIHPAFLQSDQPQLAELLSGATAPETEAAEDPLETKPELWELADGEEMATYPQGADHLQEMVIQALTPMLGVVPAPDHEGDIPVRADTAVAFVCVAPSMPLVTIYAHVVVDVQDEAAAVIEAGLLNKETPGVQFSVSSGVVAARMVLPATPFVPPLLRIMLARMLHVLARVDKDLARRVQGRVFVAEPGQVGAPPNAGEHCACASPDDRGDRGHQAGRDAAGWPDESEADGAGEWAAQRLGAMLDRMHPVLAQMVVNDLKVPHSLRPITAARFCGDDPRVMRKVLRSSLRAQATLRECRREAASRHDDEAEHLFRNVRRSTRRVRAAVDEALRRAQR